MSRALTFARRESLTSPRCACGAAGHSLSSGVQRSMLPWPGSTRPVPALGLAPGVPLQIALRPVAEGRRHWSHVSRTTFVPCNCPCIPLTSAVLRGERAAGGRLQRIFFRYTAASPVAPHLLVVIGTTRLSRERYVTSRVVTRAAASGHTREFGRSGGLHERGCTFWRIACRLGTRCAAWIAAARPGISAEGVVTARQDQNALIHAGRYPALLPVFAEFLRRELVLRRGKITSACASDAVYQKLLGGPGNGLSGPVKRSVLWCHSARSEMSRSVSLARG